ncbi:beta-ketoacyl-[acyl-carrier-protein] synthase family protein [Luteirhabdus pelagi]|uniref:beta-ketoacyl-[acyl-carrier-protein] synthase family protein n=1 Tax=Luteirhabdus pelagi TaxID=2792783 RepID=UPI00193966B6|nr:beta-ketoacyl-[acyl-carrier-protein] synthase family protein [Luteirhabdus pelagi]
MKRNRVVITGMGIVSPNGVGIPSFLEALKNGESGIRYFPELAELNFSCQVGGKPVLSEGYLENYLNALEQRKLKSDGIIYGILAALEAMEYADIPLRSNDEPPDWNMGVVFGTGSSGAEKFREAIYQVDDGNVRRLGSTTVPQIMVSGISAYISGKIGAGNWVTTNSSACATGAESILMGYEHIASGKATKMLCGSSGDVGPYIWGGFDAMRVTNWKHNANPEQASRPISASANGFVPSGGAGALVLETLESAQQRNATIYAEVLGGAVNNGGQRQGGSMTAPNSEAVQRCIRSALQNAEIEPSEIDTINGHLTATAMDATEISNWCEALNRKGSDFPYINSLKGMIGHGLAASGSMETIATILQLQHDFIFPNINCEDVHPDILRQISEEKIPKQCINTSVKTAIKASFGFGDVNACIIFRKN